MGVLALVSSLLFLPLEHHAGDEVSGRQRGSSYRTHRRQSRKPIDRAQSFTEAADTFIVVLVNVAEATVEVQEPAGASSARRFRARADRRAIHLEDHDRSRQETWSAPRA